jgi:alkaline phosphatase D
VAWQGVCVKSQNHVALRNDHIYDITHQVNQTATFKFIVTSVPFTSLWTRDAQTDSWAGYASEKASLLSALHTVPNVYLLSGDRHEFAAIEFNPLHEVGTGAHVVREFSTSPLSMFYVPLFRTLRLASEAVVPRTRLRIIDEESPPEEVVEEVPMEHVIKYLPIGNYKWCVPLVLLTIAPAPDLVSSPRAGLRSRLTRAILSIRYSNLKL